MGQNYQCIQAHTSQQDWNPELTRSLWQLISSPTLPDGAKVWTPWISYKLDDIVFYNGVKYVCIQPHVAQPGWEPERLPSLWTTK
ncbi:hypothetical protein AMS62_06385 [Bacillus sp. FJAT-18019]|uniref:Chitin-binding type-3 domain-containing protein n=2 Tax=Paenibacillus solani TaxID=1705565 RepID=A0A0M1P0Z1_9BACL|nr:hypothetical protein AMS62_06385 [Bacillus sp. FJAT-18019]KOR87774.1 hypothetical protein AM231_00525 [Paenibacillus solani]